MIPNNWNMSQMLEKAIHYRPRADGPTGIPNTGPDMLNLVWNTHNRHPIAHPSGRAIGCLLWVLILICFHEYRSVTLIHQWRVTFSSTCLCQSWNSMQWHVASFWQGQFCPNNHDIPQLTHEGEVWGAFCESEFWSVFMNIDLLY